MGDRAVGSAVGARSRMQRAGMALDAPASCLAVSLRGVASILARRFIVRRLESPETVFLTGGTGLASTGAMPS
jgi:hypothetical protein